MQNLLDKLCMHEGSDGLTDGWGHDTETITKKRCANRGQTPDSKVNSENVNLNLLYT